MSRFVSIKSSQDSAMTHVKTSVSVTTLTFKWKIEKFSKLPLDVGIFCGEFYPQPDDVWSACLKKTATTCSFLFSRNTGDCIRIKYNITIQNNNDQVLYHVSSSLTDFKPQTSYCVLPYIHQNKLAELDCQTDDIIIFNCVIEISGKPETGIHSFDSDESIQLHNLETLSKNLNSILEDSSNADVTLRVEDSSVFAHKAILCSRSPVFAKMLQSDMLESRSNTISIFDLDLHILKGLIAFLYTGTIVEDDFEALCSLYYAANKYDVSSLQMTCASILLSKLDANNACRLLVLADLHDDEDFKSGVIILIRFYFDKVLETDSWQDLIANSTKLAVQVMNSGYNEKK